MSHAFYDNLAGLRTWRSSELRQRRRPGHGDQRCAVLVGADQRHHPLDEGDQEGEDEGEVSEFGDHCATVAAVLCALSMASWASGGM